MTKQQKKQKYPRRIELTPKNLWALTLKEFNEKVHALQKKNKSKLFLLGAVVYLEKDFNASE